MNTFGKLKLTPLVGTSRQDLFLLVNPVGENDMWGILLDNGIEVVPPDGFVTDLSSSGPFQWIYPKTTAKQAAVYHDFVTRAHKYTIEEIYGELKPWFDACGFTYDDSVDYVHWLRDTPASAWHRDYYDLAVSVDRVPRWKAWLAWKALLLFGWISWRSKPEYKTRDFRLRREAVCLRS